MAEQNTRRTSNTTPPGHPGPAMGMPMGAAARGMMIPSKAKNGTATLKRIWGYLKVQRAGLLAVAILTALSSAATLTGPYLLGISFDRYIIPRDYDGLLRVSLILLVIYVIGAIAQWLQSYIMAAVAQRTVLHMRRELFDRLQNLPLPYFDSKRHGELMSRTTNDMDTVSNTLNQSVSQLMTSVLTLTGALTMMLLLNIWLTLLTLVTIPLVILITGKISARTRLHFKGQQQQLGELNGFIEETVAGQKVVQVFRREQKTIEQFDTINLKLRHVGMRAQTLSGAIIPIMNVVNNLSFALIAAVGGWMAFHTLTTIGVIVSFLSYSKQFGRPINELANQFNMIQSAIAGAERVFEVMDIESEHRNNSTSKQLVQVRGEVTFQDVSFSYKPGVPILKDVNLQVKPGQTIALVGPTGAGKTTIVNLLTRFYEIDEGSILIDGTDIRMFDKNSLRNRLGIVLQDAYLFSDTIRENIRYGRLDASDAEIERAAALANADSFIRKLPQGYGTQLTEEGGNLSHGQRQLLTIARAILADPAILILDEATSSVDTRTEMHIQEAMQSLMQGRTSFVIAHRLSTIRDADLILVINGGQIIERGTHRQLLEQRGYYHDLYTTQFQRVI